MVWEEVASVDESSLSSPSVGCRRQSSTSACLHPTPLKTKNRSLRLLHKTSSFFDASSLPESVDKLARSVLSLLRLDAHHLHEPSLSHPPLSPSIHTSSPSTPATTRPSASPNARHLFYLEGHSNASPSGRAHLPHHRGTPSRGPHCSSNYL